MGPRRAVADLLLSPRRFLNPGRLVGPGVPSVLTDGKTPFVVKPPWPGAKKTGRRLALARWLTRPIIRSRPACWSTASGSTTSAPASSRRSDNFGKAGDAADASGVARLAGREFVRSRAGASRRCTG